MRDPTAPRGDAARPHKPQRSAYGGAREGGDGRDGQDKRESDRMWQRTPSARVASAQSSRNQAVCAGWRPRGCQQVTSGNLNETFGYASNPRRAPVSIWQRRLDVVRSLPVRDRRAQLVKRSPHAGDLPGNDENREPNRAGGPLCRLGVNADLRRLGHLTARTRQLTR